MNLTREQLWDKLNVLSSDAKPIRDLVASDAKSARQRLFDHGPMYIDYARQDIDGVAMQTLQDLARASSLEARIQDHFSGAAINESEDRAVLHMAFRDWASRPWQVAGKSVTSEVEQLQLQAWDHAEQTKAQFSLKHIVVLGIGGSSSGAKLLLKYLGWSQEAEVEVTYFESFAGGHLSESLANMPLANTIVLVVSKSFGTSETMGNAEVAKQAMGKAGLSKQEIAKRMIAITANIAAAKREGYVKENTLALPAWVGGRYSIWTSTSYAVIAAFGRKAFQKFLSGAAQLDRYFTSEPLASNHVIQLALSDVWQRTFKKQSHWMIAPYHDALSDLVGYLQQLIMESNGKLTRDPTRSSAAVWGGPGTEFQHSFGQWMHQGDARAWVDFISVVDDPVMERGATQARFEHMLAQSAALMNGQASTQQAGGGFPGNRPSNIILLKQLNAQALGALLALYEHRCFVQAAIWDINAFDQPGVELGKVMSEQVHQAFSDEEAKQRLDHSSAGLVDYFAQAQRQAL